MTNETPTWPSEDDALAAIIDTTALLDVAIERALQDAKWGTHNHHAFGWITILGEEFGEACKAALEEDSTGYREELVQVAAVAMAAIEAYDRHGLLGAPREESA